MSDFPVSQARALAFHKRLIESLGLSDKRVLEGIDVVLSDGDYGIVSLRIAMPKDQLQTMFEEAMR